MVETGEKVSSSSSHKRKDLKFFKVFLPEFSSHELVIPPAFIDILEKPLPNETLLLNEIGQIWCVETITEDTEERFRVVLKKGWEIFANDQSLEFGDFLVFSYDGESRFSVTTFAKDGCKKDFGVVTTAYRTRSRVSVEKEPVIKPVEILTKPKRLEDNSKLVRQNRKRILVKEESLVNDEFETASTSKTKPETRQNSRGKSQLRDHNEISWFPVKKHKGIEKPVYKSKKPHFVRTITQASLQIMEIPSTLLKSNNIEMEEDIEVCDENGKKWASKIVKREKRIRLSEEPWKCFCKSHKLMKNSKCLFEFIVGNNGRCKEIHVRIFSGELATSVTRYGYQVLAM